MLCRTCGGVLSGRNKVYCSRLCHENRPHIPTSARFWRKVDKSGDCWEWRGHRNSDGYGSFGVTAGDSWLAHRLAYHLTFGTIPEGTYVLHRCDNPGCVLGTQSDNMQDSISKGRFHRACGERASLSKMTTAQVLEIRRRRRTGELLRDIAKDFGLTPEGTGAIALRKVWNHIPEENPELGESPKWITCGERHSQAVLTVEAVLSIRREHRAGTESVDALAKRYGVSRASIWNVIRRVTWASVPEEDSAE
jgi:hypothetical protein